MPHEPSTTNFLSILDTANKVRNTVWDPHGKLDATFFALELGGEVGELLNMQKKLERESLGLPGSRVTRAQLLEEIGDVYICISLFCIALGISPDEAMQATVDKFNKTSTKLGLPVHMALHDIGETA